MVDLDARHRTVDFNKQRVVAVVAVAVSGGQRGVITRLRIGVRQDQVRASRQGDRDQVAVGVIGTDGDLTTVGVDVVYAEINVGHAVRELNDIGAVAIPVRAKGFKAAVAVDRLVPAIDARDVDRLGFELGRQTRGIIVRRGDRHGDGTGVLAQGQTLKIVAIIYGAVTIVILIRQLAPVKALADSGVTIGAAAVTKDNVIAHTTDQGVVVRAAENLIIALGAIDPVIARTGGHDVVVANLTGQDRVQRVDQVPIGIAQIGAVDDVATIRPFDNAVAQHIAKVKAEVADADIAALVVAIAVVVDDLQTHDRACNVDVDGVRVACAIDVGVPVGGAFDRVAIHGLQGGVDVAEIDGNQIAIGVIGQNGHLVVPLTVGRIHIVEREGHIAHRLVKGQDRGRRLRDVVAGQIAVAVDEKACVTAAGRGRDRHPKAVTTGREQAKQAVGA